MTRIALLALCLLSACASTVQTSSGAAYLSARAAPTDPAVIAAAAQEPDLRFPANIGIARIDTFTLLPITNTTLATLANSRPRPDPLGTFVPVSPLIAQTLTLNERPSGIRIAQLAAARQHLDYVLIYHLTQDGAGLAATGKGEAILMDVRSGYVYGTATVQTTLAGYNRVRLGWGRYTLSDRAAAQIMTVLAPEVETMLTQIAARAGATR